MRIPNLFLACAFLGMPLASMAINTRDTRMLSQPAISADHIAFIYAQDLWVANTDGSQPRRLTVSEGVESSPVFSPDGKLIAFSGQYDGNVDVFVIPVEGGVPKRLTYHPGADIVRGFTPDGKSVLFASQRSSFTNRYLQLFTVPVTGGPETELEIPNAFYAAYSPDGSRMAYTPIPDAFRQWKHYRGGSITHIQLFSFGDMSLEKIPQPAGGCNDASPVWIGNTVYFRSDRDGEFNVYAYDLATKQVRALTSFTDFPVLNLAGRDGKLVFEQAGYLHVIDLSGGQASAEKRLVIGIAADLLELRSRYVSGFNYIRSGDISPSGARLVVDFRGDIVTLPADKGDARNLTHTTAIHETSPAWSTDGKSIAYFSDASGENVLCIQPENGKGAVRTIPLKGAGFYDHLRWSPDSKKLSFTDNSRTLYVLDVASGEMRKVDSDELYGPGAFREMASDWSYDSRWLAYTKVTGTQFKRIYLYSLTEGKSYPLTDGLSDVEEPKFDAKGKYVYFFASTDAGPVLNWFDQSSIDMRQTKAIYLVTLQKETISPFAKENDEEIKDTATEKKREQLRIDWEGIQDRIIDLPVKVADMEQLGVGKNDVLYYIVRGADGQGGGTLHKYDLKKRSDQEVMEVGGYKLSADGKKMLLVKGETIWVVDAGEKPGPGKNPVAVDIQVKVDPAAEWAEIFDEAWRVNRDYFYDPNMHGVDWAAVKKKYTAFLPDLACRDDLNQLIQWMGSELSIGHHFILSGGDHPFVAKFVNGGLLGADYEASNGRWRIKKIYGGLNWNPSLRSPLTEPGVNAQVGDYILTVNGQDVKAEDNFYRFFENTAGKIVELTIGPNADGSGSRVVKVVPVPNEFALRNRDWVEGNLKKVEAATGGKVAYVYVPNTAQAGHDYFKRYFFPQADRQAIIVDERFNGGGDLADYYITLLTRPYQSHWHTRYGHDFKSPFASIDGPKVMIIDETAGSGGDMLPWMFHKFGLGTIVGKRTWGGLVGILGYPILLDGGMVTAPNVGIWTKDGFVVENVGVSPDIEVEQTPADVIKGRDPQLEKAIQVVMQQLAEHPQTEPVRPPMPVVGTSK
ncbi:S41 family peptidase [Puia dinghuensis]|uniref:Tricorn protease homolog n=1 Tax=Puia dinghuensis TaxID=1792502 RepID=A0A8J2UHL1_9BACT|nr:S41 family peptidase [Puia dinghuensis]GGB18169.1 tricorn protease [Puia dinghuensis]